MGDEFQGALKSPEKAYDAYTFIKASLPVPIYCGLGLGEVQIAAQFRIAEATLSKLLKAAHWTEISEGDQIIAALLGQPDSF